MQNGNYILDGDGNRIINSSQNVNFCGEFYIDTNGAKGPNQFGQDIFLLLFFPTYFSQHSSIPQYGDLNAILKTGIIN